MTTLTETRHAAEFLVRDDGYRSRDKVVVASGANLVAGTVLGRVVAASVTQVYAGTGNGVLTPDATTPLLAGVQEGAYKVICIEPGTNVGTFAVYDPNGVLLGTHVVAAAAFANQIKFAIADGSTDFVSGDTFTIYVKAGTASAVTGTGNGTLTLYQTTEGAQVGTYSLVCTAAATNSGTFSVTAPDGTSLGAATVAVRYTKGGLDFIVNDGSTDYIVGDSFTIAVTRGKVKMYDPASVDGSGSAAYGVLYDAAAAASADVNGVAIVRHAEINPSELTWFSGATGAQKATGLAYLLARGIVARA